MGVFLAIPLLFSILLFVVSYNLFQRFKYKLPPGPISWPIIGNTSNVNPVLFRCFNDWAQIYGPIISFKSGSELNVVVSNAELAKQVLKEHDQYLADRKRPPGGMVQKDDVDFIWADYGPHYVKIRKVSSLTLFNPKKIGAHRPIREDEVSALVESLFNDCTNPENKGKALAIRKYIDMLSFNNITRITFGKRFVNSKGEFDSIGKEIKGKFSRLVVNPIKGNVFVTYLQWIRRLWSLPNKVEVVDDGSTNLGKGRDQIMKDMIKEQAQAYDSKDMDGSIAKQHFVEALLTLKNEYDLSEDDIFWLCWDMIVAGVDTITISIEWALTELLRNPRVQKKAQEELDRVIGNERILSEEDFSNLPYLQAIAKESLRHHPPTPLMLPHKAKTRVKVGGYDVPKGSTIHVNVWALGHDPDVWGDDVNEFRPERFFKVNIDMKGHDFRLLPFGAGRRICPGAQVAINLVTLTLGHLLHHFDWNPPNGVKLEEIDMSENPGVVTFMKTPLQAIPTPRLPARLYKRLSAEM